MPPGFHGIPVHRRSCPDSPSDCRRQHVHTPQKTLRRGFARFLGTIPATSDGRCTWRRWPPLAAGSSAQTLPVGAQVPYGKFMKDPAVWAVITAHFCFNWGYYTLLSWLPSYFDLALGLKVSQSSILTLVPYLAMVCMTPFVGPTADGMIASGMPVTRVRKICQAVSLLGPALCMCILAVLTPQGGVAAAQNLNQALVWGLVACLSVAFALSAWARAGLYCNHQDMSPKCAACCTASAYLCVCVCVCVCVCA